MLTAHLPTTTRSLGDLLAQAGRAEASGEIVVVERTGVRHAVVIRGGGVVRARVAGRFDPLLWRLLSAGEIDESSFLAVLEAMATSDRLAGELAVEVARASPDAVRAALARQARDAVSTLLHRAQLGARATWLDPRPIEPRRADPALPWVTVVRGTPRAARLRSPASRSAPPPPSRDAARRELRRLARTLHPDLHAHLPPSERDALAARLARATAAYHATSP